MSLRNKIAKFSHAHFPIQIYFPLAAEEEACREELAAEQSAVEQLAAMETTDKAPPGKCTTREQYFVLVLLLLPFLLLVFAREKGS